MSSASYLLLSLAGQEVALHGQAQDSVSETKLARCLNSAGRWAIQGTAAAPLLVWPLSLVSEAQAAAERATAGRERPVQVITASNASWIEGQTIVLFSPAYEAALSGATPLSSGRARRLAVEVEKLEAFCLIVRAASDAKDHDALVAVGRAAAKALQARFGGGSVTSTFAWLAGPNGREALASVLAGEVELTSALSVQQVVDAVQLARQTEQVRLTDEGGPTLH